MLGFKNLWVASSIRGTGLKGMAVAQCSADDPEPCFWEFGGSGLGGICGGIFASDA